MKIDYEHFKELEEFKRRVRAELIAELINETSSLRFSDSGDGPRNGNMVVAAEAEDNGFKYALTKVQYLLTKK